MTQSGHLRLGPSRFFPVVRRQPAETRASTVQDVEEFRSAIDLFKVQDQIRRASCLRLSQDGYCVVEEFIDHGLQPVFEHWFFCKDIRELRVRLTVFGRDRHFRLELLGLWMGSA